MEIEGKVIAVLGEKTGTSKASGKPWIVREYVLETKDNFPKKVAFDFFGDKAEQYKLSVGDEIRLSFDIESREYMGRWYTSIRGWKSEPIAATGPVDGVQSSVGDILPPPPVVAPDNSEDLPF